MTLPFATKAISALTIEAMTIPDFLAGFMYGFTGENHLVEIEQCYKGSDELLNDVQTALADIKAESYIKGIEVIGNVINEFPGTLKDCEHL